MGIAFMVWGVKGFLWLKSSLMIVWSPSVNEVSEWLTYYLPGIAVFVCGFLLLFGGRWITSLAIPKSGQRCPHCAYDLSDASAAVCVECGEMLERGLAERISGHQNNKTFFRMLLKLVGVVLFILGLESVLDGIVSYYFMTSGMPPTPPHISLEQWLRTGLPGILQIAFGLYFFFGGKWVTNLAVRSNRPLCGECGYDLTGCSAGRCPECGHQADART
jgi:hypothetical protein